jgi:hypothetical protein
VQGVYRECLGCTLSQKRLRLRWNVDECKPLPPVWTPARAALEPPPPPPPPPPLPYPLQDPPRYGALAVADRSGGLWRTAPRRSALPIARAWRCLLATS